MKKLTTLFAIVALSTTVGLAGCKKKNAAEGSDKAAPADKPAEGDKMAGDKAATPPTPDKKPDDKAAAAPAAAGDLPQECQDYKAAIDKLSSCDKMPQQARDAMKQGFDTASAAWANLPADQKAALATGCKAGTDAVNQSAKAVCGW
jgi:hypothetical protein